MSKMYTSKKAGYTVLSGKVTDISEDRQGVTVSYNEYSFETKKNTKKSVVVHTMSPVNTQEVKVGGLFTAVGAPMGVDTFNAVHISTKNSCFESPNLSVISGLVDKVRYNDEKDEEGNPKMKRPNEQGVSQPRKPHFDVFVTTNDGTKDVHHIIKVYDVKTSKFSSENIEKYSKRFEGVQFDMAEPENTPLYATIVTQPGQEFSIASDNQNEAGDSQIYYGASHMGINSLDLEPLYELTRKKTTPTATKTATPKAPATEQQAQTEVQKNWEAVADQVNVEGFDEDIVVPGLDTGDDEMEDSFI